MIETERLILREWRDADRDEFLAMCNSPAVMEHLGGPATRDEIDAGITRIQACQAEHGHCFWAVERRADDAFLGFCGLKRAGENAIRGEVEIGWRLRQEAWGKGYAREGAEASLSWGWANLDTRRIVAITVEANRRSWGLMQRIGMVRRPDLDFVSEVYPEGHSLHHEIVYAIERPVTPR